MSALGEERALARGFHYDRWIESLDLPIYHGFYIEDLRTLELGDWPERGCRAAFIQLTGQEGIAEARVSEIAPAAATTPVKFALDEAIYVVEGRGLATVAPSDGGPSKSFEWQPHSMFLVPRNYVRQLSNVQGDRPARLLHYNLLPLGMSLVAEPDFFFDNPYSRDVLAELEDFYAEAKVIRDPAIEEGRAFATFWWGNFFPDMRAWDRLIKQERRGAGGSAVFIRFAGSDLYAHMSVFPARTYKKAHRHGPGRVILIPGGEGFSVLWQEGQEKIVVPWHEASLFVPPNRWFHQHFNLGATPARYLAMHPPRQFSGHGERVEDAARDIIQYPDEEPWIRERFDRELAERGLSSLMPPEVYTDPGYRWTYADD